MADVVTSLRSWLLEQDSLKPCIGQRIYSEHYPQNAKLPLIVLTRLTTSHEHTLGNLAGVAHARIQFDCVADTRSQANLIAKACRKSGAMSFRGDMHGLFVCGITLEDGARDGYDPPNDATEKFRYWVNFDWMIDYEEDI